MVLSIEHVAPFQLRSLERLRILLSSRGVDADPQRIDAEYAIDFTIGYGYRVRNFLLEVYPSEISAVIDGGRFDSELFQHANDDEKLNDFVRRLDRAMITGNWYGEEDPTIYEAAAGSLKRFSSWIRKALLSRH